MKMGAAAPALVLLSLLLSVASARDVHMPFADDAERNHLFKDDNINPPNDLAKTFEQEVSSSEGSSTEFSRVCLEIARRAKDAVKDRSLVDKIDSLASTLCHIVPSVLEPKLAGSCESCDACHNVLDTISTVLGDTESKILIIVYLLKTCENQTNADQCKKMAFSFGPIVISALEKVVDGDVCYFLRICEFPRGKAQNASRVDMRKPEPEPCPQGKPIISNINSVNLM